MSRPNFEETIIIPPLLTDWQALPLITDTQYLEPLASNSLNRKFYGIVRAGVFRGFECAPAGGMKLRVSSGEQFGVALVERDDYILTVRQQHDIDVEIPAGATSYVVLEAFYKHGVKTKQVDLSSDVEASEIKVLPQSAVEPHHLILCRATVPTGASELTLIHLNFDDREQGGYDLQGHVSHPDPHKQYAMRDEAKAHYADHNNPHGVTKEQIKLGNVPNYPATSSVSDPSNEKFATAGAVKQAYDKGVEGLDRGNAAYTRAEQAETNANKHTDDRISTLLGGAPAEALDTIKELGDALMEQGDAAAAIAANIAQHKSDTSNPHKVTKAQVGLANVPNYAFTAAVNDASDVKFAAAGAVKKAYDLAASKMTQAQADGRYLKLLGGTITDILSVGSSKFFMDGVNMMGAGANVTRFGDGTYARPMNLNAKDGVINVIGANGAAAKRVFHEGYKPKLSDIEITVLDLEDLDETKFYAVVLEPTDANSVGALFHVDISTKPAAGTYAYNNNTVTGFVRGGGWSDLHAMYELTCVKFADNETTIHSVWEGSENFNGVVFYIRGNQQARIRTNGNVKAIRSGTYAYGSSVFATGVSDPNSAVTKGIKLVQFDKGGYYKNTVPNHSGVLSNSLAISGAVDFNNYTLTGSYDVYDVRSATNRPPNADFGTLDVIGRGTASNSFVTQIFTRKTDCSQYIRTRNDGSFEWTSWKKIYSEALKPTAVEVGAQPVNDKLNAFVSSLVSTTGQDFKIREKRAMVGTTANLIINYANDYTTVDVQSSLSASGNIYANSGTIQLAGAMNLTYSASKGLAVYTGGVNKAGWFGARNTTWFHLETDATNGFYSYSHIEAPSLRTRGSITASTYTAAKEFHFQVHNTGVYKSLYIWDGGTARGNVWEMNNPNGSGYLFYVDKTMTSWRTPKFAVTGSVEGVAVNATGAGSGQGLMFDGKTAIGGASDWLRLNTFGQFANGIYCGSVGILRHDNQLQIGAWTTSNKSSRVHAIQYDSSWGNNGIAAFSVNNPNSSGAHWAFASYYDANNIRSGMQILSNAAGNIRFYTNGRSKYAEIAEGNVYAGSPQSSAANSLTRKDYVDSEISKTKLVLEHLFPVGHVIITFNTANPSTYGYPGTWVRMDNDTTLYSTTGTPSTTPKGSNTPNVPVAAHTHKYARVTKYRSHGVTSAGYHEVDMPTDNTWGQSVETGRSTPRTVAMSFMGNMENTASSGTSGATLDVRGKRYDVAMWRRTK
ncbi:pyocin knob domain-containing protein [Vibrio parahaemolyticus]|uniref:pyocin knob domain-containing protein n=4 Tax=Vibrio parahaemolyticus TaxID=670 RepID=UPI00287A5FBF|nr:pyocin knob domain-containing protein [Vibrio parahaemolyticus]MDS1996464.1 pyocin knob domain-containing protein [Vibrio parahaemolyticus]MDS1996480.1 pyocin knob domain-containing protein [Vibrio parahaemolyticus]